MFILKIHVCAFERTPSQNSGAAGLFDEHWLFVHGERIDVHGRRGQEPDMTTWSGGEYEDRRSYVLVSNGVNIGQTEHDPGRLVEVVNGDRSEWFLVSEAYICGPTGDTIERVLA